MSPHYTSWLPSDHTPYGGRTDRRRWQPWGWSGQSPMRTLQPDHLSPMGTSDARPHAHEVAVGPGPSLFLVAWIPSPPGGGCLPAFFEILGALSGITPPPPGGGGPRVGWDFLGKLFVSKIFILPLSSVLPDPASTLAACGGRGTPCQNTIAAVLS